MYRIMLTFISGLAMIYTKSETGLHAIKDRHAVDITRAQRSALILFDGKRSLREVLDATASLGVTASDVEVLVASGLLQPSAAVPGAARFEGSAAASQTAARPDDAAAPLSEEERVRRYRVAYPLATQLTAKLGLKGFTLNLAVESAQGFDGLVELLPRLRGALGDEGVRPLQAVLQGR